MRKPWRWALGLAGALVIAAPRVQAAGVPVVLPSTLAAAPPAVARPERRLTVSGQKYAAPNGKRTEAGVEWKLDSRVSIQLNYERTAQAPMMPSDHDDGILTRLRVRF